MKTVGLEVDPETGEILPANVMVAVEKAPAIIIDIDDVRLFHAEPQKLVDKIRAQAGFAVFDVSNEKGRAACRSHAANIIKCISPAINASKQLAADAQKVVKADLTFRKIFEADIREIAEFHRRPLTEYEAEQKRIQDEQDAREAARLEEEKYLVDWDDALHLDELFTFRKEKERSEAIAAAEAKAIEDKRLFDEAVAKQAEENRVKIQEEERRKAESEQAAKLEEERAKVRAEEQAKFAEERKLDKLVIVPTKPVDAAFDTTNLRKSNNEIIGKKTPSDTIEGTITSVRPSDKEILQAVAFYFNAHENQVIKWFEDMDLSIL